MLESIEGLNNVAVSQNIRITGNISLSECNITSVCENIAQDRGVSVFFNGAGCSEITEIEESCNN